jgi:hypothetical protein
MKKSVQILSILVCLSFACFAFAAEEKPLELKAPVLVTSCGQSPGALMFKLIAKKAKVDCVKNDSLTAEKLAQSNAKTLIITMGTSLKGMGAAGTSIADETKRITVLIAAAKKAGITVVGAHIEGMARRVDKADTISIEAVAPFSDLLIVKEASNEDGYFTRLAKEKNIRMLSVKNPLDLVGVFSKIFK